MNQDNFKAAYSESRNGADFFVRHSLVRSFVFSNGVQEVAEAGCHWMLDIIATECVDTMRKDLGEYRGQVDVIVDIDGKAKMQLTYADDAPPVWTRTIDWTDMPEGRWTFMLANDDGLGRRYSLILVSEY